MNNCIKEEMIQKLTELYLKSYNDDKQKGKQYIKKTEFIKEFIQFVKEYL